MRAKPSRHKPAGFTLIEMMTVVAIAAILLSIGIPSMRSLLENQRATTTANKLLAAINLTRSEAIQRGTRVDLVPMDGGWSNGWMVFVDENNNQKADPGERVIHVNADLPAGTSIESNMNADYLAYQGSGRTRTNASSQAVMFGQFTILVGEQERRVIINMLGRARACKPAAPGDTC